MREEQASLEDRAKGRQKRASARCIGPKGLLSRTSYQAEKVVVVKVFFFTFFTFLRLASHLASMPCFGPALFARCAIFTRTASAASSFTRTAAAAASATAPRFSLVAPPRRFLSSSPHPSPPTGLAGVVYSAQRALAISLNTWGPYASLAVGGSVVVYGVSSLALHVTSTFLSLSLTDALYGGFGAGFLSCGMLVAGGLRSYKSITIHPDAVFRLALGKVQRDERVASALGATVAAGPLQAYNLVPGHVSTQKLGWVDPRVQMLFQVEGKDTGREGMVRSAASAARGVCVFLLWGAFLFLTAQTPLLQATVEAIKHKGVLKVTLLTLDILPAHGAPPIEPILVAGKEDRLHVRGQLRGFLQTERAAFVPQDKPLRDEALFALQEEAEATLEEDRKEAEGLKA